MNTLWKPSGLRSHSARSAGSKACASTPLLFSAASTALPERNEISLSDEGPPISTATFPNSLIRFPRPATTHNVDGRLLRPPAPAASRYRVGLAPSAPPPFRTRSFDSRVPRPRTMSMGGCFALPHQPLRGTESGSPHQHPHLSKLAHSLPAFRG